MHLFKLHWAQTSLSKAILVHKNKNLSYIFTGICDVHVQKREGEKEQIERNDKEAVDWTRPAPFVACFPHKYESQ